MSGSSDVTGSEVTGSDVTRNDFIGSDVTGSVREIISRTFFLTGCSCVLSSETPRGLLGNIWEFPIGHSILPAAAALW